MKAPKLIVLQLNELNFDVVRAYLVRYELPAFRELLRSFRYVETFAEERYEHLEPWIQWVSAHTGKTYDEHGVFRLGDFVNSDLPQVFELLEERGLRVGALSPMNSCNRLRQPAFFVPDPWTQTPSDESGYSRRLTEMLRQSVNENTQSRISARSLLTLLEAFARTLNPLRTIRLCALAARSPGRPWLRAMVLDQLIHMVHLGLMRTRRPDVSFVFLNAAAHIQHHYFLNSQVMDAGRRNPDWYVRKDADPFLDMLQTYDGIVSDYLALARQGARVIVATGLTQVPCDRLTLYYRLKDHEAFLRRIGLRFARVLPRMTRDFEILFDDDASASVGLRLLKSMRIARDGQPVFGEIEERRRSLFVTLTYPDEILPLDTVGFSGGQLAEFGRMVSFVAIKNGMHSSKGFVYLSPGVPAALPTTPVHVARLFDLTMEAAG